jgi:protein phosphatase
MSNKGYKMMFKLNVLTASEKYPPITLKSFGLSIHGSNRPVNEDFVFHRNSKTADGTPLVLMIVCDGIGGYQESGFASELAAQLVVKEIGKIFPCLDACSGKVDQQSLLKDEKVENWLTGVVQEANHLIYQYVQNQSEIKKIGTRLTMALIQGNTAYVAHVGDTRAYLWRNFELTQITSDHSYVAELGRQGILNEEQLLHHPLRKILSRAIGTRPEVEPEFSTLTLWPGDKLLLCSDGLWNAFDDPQRISEILINDLPTGELCSWLVEEAKTRDGGDDMSVALAVVQSAESEKIGLEQ